LPGQNRRAGLAPTTKASGASSRAAVADNAAGAAGKPGLQLAEMQADVPKQSGASATRPNDLFKDLAKHPTATFDLRDRIFNRKTAKISIVLTALGVVVAVMAIWLAHIDARNPPSPTITKILAFNPAAPANPPPAGSQLDVDCAWTSAVTERQDAMTCMLVDNMLFDPCFNVDPTEVVCPSANAVTGDGKLNRYRIKKIHEFVDGPPTQPQTLEYVEKFDLPWAVQVGGSNEWCYLSHWIDETQLGLTKGSRPYVCQSESMEAFMDGADAFFANRSRLALVMKRKSRTTRVVYNLERTATLWTAQRFDPNSSSTVPVQISSVIF
jgi:hypothetical protein